jgi:prepilin-type N-terminal cleavage/methylation domain-containing protein
MKLLATTYSKQPGKGFTLIELLVVIVVTSIIATISLANYRKGERNRKVTIASDGLVQTLTTAQTNILSGKAIEPSTCIQGKAPVAYTVTFQHGNQNIQMNAIDKCLISYPIQTYVISTGVRIKPVEGIKLNGANVADTLLIRFNAPFGSIQASTGGALVNITTPATVTVQSTADTTFTRTVTVDGVSGRITQ